MPSKEFFKMANAAGDTLNGYIMKPADFDASKKYPAIMYQYSGPGAQLVLNRWELDWMHYAAESGYVISNNIGGNGATGVLRSSAFRITSEKMYIRFDWAIKRLLRQKANFGALEGFLTVFLGERIRIVEILESDSLPLGILEGVRPTTLTRTLSDGDVLLFLSDGITAAFGSSADIAEFLGAERANNPQTLAEKLLCAALERAGGTAEDDMTAIAVRLFSAA